MTNGTPSPAPKPSEDVGLRQTLDRIAAAIEKGNDLAEKKGGADKGDDQKGGGDGKKEDADKDKNENDGKDKKEGNAKHFFLSPLGIILTLIVLAILIVAGVALGRYESTHVTTDDAYTTADVHQVSPRVSGLVLEVWVNDNQEVKAGALLVKLDTRDYDVALQRARANLDQAKAQALQAATAIEQARANYDEAQAQVTQARAGETQVPGALRCRRNRLHPQQEPVHQGLPRSCAG